MTTTPTNAGADERGGSPTPPPSPAVTKRPNGPGERRWLPPAGLVAATLIAFSPAGRNAFVNWDDDVNIVYNLAFRGLASENLRWMFSTSLGGHYQPLSWLSYALDYRLGGMNPAVYHWTNIFLHAAAGLLFYFVALRLLRAAEGKAAPDLTGRPDPTIRWCAAAAAAIFAVHPLRVESVAWVTERRDVLSGVLLCAAVLSYLAAVQGRRGRVSWYGFSIILYAASLLAKAAGMTLALVLLIMDVYPLRRQRDGAGWGRLLAEKLPFAALGIAAGYLATRAQQSAGAWRELAVMDWPARLATAAQGWWFYLYKLLRPTQLSPLYPLPAREELLGSVSWAAGAALVLTLVLAIAYRRKWPAILAALLAYGVLLAPVSGLAQSGKQFAADRYTYLPLLPFALLIAGGLLKVNRRAATRPEEQRTARVFEALAGVFVVAIGLLTIAQCTVWRDSVTLWQHAARLDPTSSVAFVNLADAHRLAGDADSALGAYEEGRKLNPTDAKAWNGVGAMLVQRGQPHESLAYLEKAVELAPEHPEYRRNLAYVLTGFRRLDEAVVQYREAARLAPQWPLPAERAGAILISLGRYAEARAELDAALTRGAGDAAMWGTFAWLLATCPVDEIRDGARAVELARQVVEASPGDPWALDTLAAAYAESGDFESALRTAQNGLDLARTAGQAELTAAIQGRMAGYREGRPHREAVEPAGGAPGN